MKHGCTADPTMPGTVDESTGSVITASTAPVYSLSDAERVAIREMGKVTMACERGEMTKDEALRRIAALVAADDERIARENRSERL